MGGAHFRSGVSYGKGLTTRLQYEEGRDGITYGDTPGLADVELRKQAAAEISRALKSGDDDYKLIFVVTEQAGRVNPADGVTINLVLGALQKDPSMHIPYAIVVNKITKKRAQTLKSDVLKKKTFIACLNNGRPYPTVFIHLNEFREELEDEENALHEPSAAFKNFLAVVPHVRIAPKNVKDVQVDQYDKLVEKYETAMKELQADKKRLEEEIKRNQRAMEKQIKELQEKAKKEQADKKRIESEMRQSQSKMEHQVRDLEGKLQKKKRNPILGAFEDLGEFILDLF